MVDSLMLLNNKPMPHEKFKISYIIYFSGENKVEEGAG